MGSNLPDGWTAATIGEIANVVGGGTPKTSVDEYWEGGIGWLAPKDLRGYEARYISAGERSITQAGLEKSSARLLPAGTVLVSSRAPIGYVALAKTQLSTNQGFKSLVLKPGYLPEFYYYVMKTKKPEMENVAGGSTFKEISGRVMKTITVPVPPIEEQRAIAEVLGSLDDRIEWCDSGTQLSHAVARSLAERCEQDEMVLLGDVAEIKRSTISTRRLRGHAWTHYSIPAYDAGQRPRVELGSDIRSGKLEVPANSVLVSKLNPTWPRVWLPGENEVPAAICSTELMPIVPLQPSEAAAGLLWAGLLTQSFNRQLQERVQGTTGSHQRVRPEEMLTCRIADLSLLSLSERDLVAGLAERVRALRLERQALTRTRDSLLPKLLSGELRIESPERLLEGVA